MISKKTPRGFTLIELLVVIAIIAILAAILFPVFAKVREKARQTACMSNMKQLCLGFSEYTDDFDDSMPGLTYGPNGNNATGGWMWYTSTTPTNVSNTQFDPTKGSLYPYIKAIGVYVCPDDNLGQQNNGYGVTGTSYAANECIALGALTAATYPTVNSTEPRPGKALAYFDDPSNFMLLGEEDAGGGTTHTGGSTNDAYLNMSSSNDQISTRHTGGSNVAFVDDHVKWNVFPGTISARYQTDPLSTLQTGGEPNMANPPTPECP